MSKLIYRDPYSWGGATYPAYDGFLKGDSTLKASEQQQQQFNQQLMATFQTQFANQTKLLNFLQSKLNPMISNPQGLSPEALAAQRTSATDTITQQYQNAEKALNSNPAVEGSADLPSGVASQLKAGLLSSQAKDIAGAQDNITLANENLKQQNFWNALNVLNGQTATYNPLGYASTASAGGNTVANLGNAYKNSQQGGWESILAGAAGGAGTGLVNHFLPAG